MTNTLVTAMLLTGGSAVLSTMTGVNTVAACWLLPIGVVIYTIFGGIKSTFITDYMHTIVIIVVILLFAFSAFATNSELGSPGKVYDALVKAAELHPVDGNAEGSYLTLRSKQGGIFWVINLAGELERFFLFLFLPSFPLLLLLFFSWLTMLTNHMKVISGRVRISIHGGCRPMTK